MRFLESLIHRYRTYGDGTIAKNPLAGLGNILAGREIHDRVTAPFATPNSLLDLLFDAGTECRVTDIGIDLYEEVGTDDHRFCLGVIVVSRNDGSPTCHLLPYKFGCDVAGYSLTLTVHILSYGDVLHLRRNDTILSII